MENRSYDILSWDGSGDQNGNAIAIAHQEEITSIVQFLQQGQSVLVIGRKRLTPYIINLVQQSSGLEFAHLNNNREGSENPSVTSHLSDQLGQRLFEFTRDLPDRLDDATLEDKVLVIKHLDLMLWTVENRPASSCNDIIFWLSEFSGASILAFWDPIFILPPIVESLFDSQISLQVLHREILWKLMSKTEAQRISDDPKNLTLASQLRLYQFFSGSDVIEFRRIMSLMAKENYAPFVNTDRVFTFIRERLPAKSASLSEPDMPEGYPKVEQDLKDKVISPVRWRHKAKNGRALKQADALIPKGVLFYGPSGTGKTEWAKWLSHELSATLIVLHGPEIKSKYLGDTEAAIRALFDRARRSAPSIILVDEIDAILPSRESSQNNTDISMVNQFLTEMNGLRKEEAVIVIGTTNRSHAIDSAFKRAGRFDVAIEVGYPGDTARKAILEHYDKEFQIGLLPGAITWICDRTSERYGKFSGAHLKAICLHLLRTKLLAAEKENPAHKKDIASEAVWQEAINNVLPNGQKGSGKTRGADYM